jgi:hypothetical protein
VTLASGTRLGPYEVIGPLGDVLSSLNHPHIAVAAIYGFESQAVRALVLELVNGPTLAERIAQACGFLSCGFRL